MLEYDSLSLYNAAVAKATKTFRGSSVVERSAVDKRSVLKEFRNEKKVNCWKP